MSANLDLVRSIYAAWEPGDFIGADWADAEIEYMVVDGPSPGSWKGISAINAAWREFASAWEDFRVEVEEFRELDDERVLVLSRMSARGKASGLELGQIQTRAAHVVHLRDSKVVKLVGYWDRDRALADLGLEADESQGPLDEIDLL